MCQCFFILSISYQGIRHYMLSMPYAVSQFAGHDKVTAWKAWKAVKQNNQLLTSLGCGELTEQTHSAVLRGLSAKYLNIDQMRVLFLFNKGKDADSLPPT